MKRVLFWILSLTWGLLLTFIGALFSACLLIAGYRPKTFHGLIYFEIGYGWGGFNAGAFFFVSKDVSESTKRHEAGHGLQNIMLGIFEPFIVTIPSVIRYHYRNYLVRSGKKANAELPPYDSVWFEAQATAFGEKYFNKVII